MVGFIILGVLLVFFAIVCIRAVLFRPEKSEINETKEILINHDKIVENFISLIQCRTVSNRDDALIMHKEFDKFRRKLGKTSL
jgi:carboxypeptidase PM20D1